MRLVKSISNELLGATIGKKPEELDAVDIRLGSTVVLYDGQPIAVVQELSEGKPHSSSIKKKRLLLDI